jgi:hypothetical protein
MGGNLHFRPGGHGALLENLNDLQADLVYIKNVDNLTTDRCKEEIAFWKRVLGGCLVSIQSTVHEYLRKLRAGQRAEQAAYQYAKRDLCVNFPADFEQWPSEEQRAFLLKKLNRPIRVCGVVQNSGEPGGAPFWVIDKCGAVTLQIVEKAQVDFSSAEQERIWMSSTHFNPVDIVCGLRDFEGRPFDLRQYVDEDAVFQLNYFIIFQPFIDISQICFGDIAAGVGNAICEAAVIGQDQQAFRVIISLPTGNKR